MVAFVDSERFARLDSDVRDRLEALAQLDEFKDGDVIMTAERPYRWLALIVTGHVELRLPRSGGDDLVIGALGPGDLIGELDVKTEMPKGLAMVARETVVLRAIANNPLKHELLAHRKEVGHFLMIYSRAVSEKLRLVSEALLQLSSDAPGRSGEVSTGGKQEALLTPDEAQWLRLLGHPMEIPADTAVMSEGEFGSAFYLIDRGVVEVRKRAASTGKDHAIARLSAGDLFGLMAFVDGKPRSASVVAVDGPLACTRIESDAFDRALGLNFTVAFKFLGTMRAVLGRLFRESVERLAATAR